MSLLDHGPHTVVVTPKVQEADGYGGSKYVDGDPVTIEGCSVQALTSDEKQTLNGSEVDATDRVIWRGPWPGGPKSKVEWHDAVFNEDVTFNQVGIPRRYSMSPRTRHVDVLLQQVSAEPK